MKKNSKLAHKLFTIFFTILIYLAAAALSGQNIVHADEVTELGSIIIQPKTNPSTHRYALEQAPFLTIIPVPKEDSGSKSISDILQQYSGVSIRRWGTKNSPATISIRGSQANQVNIYINGVPMNNALTGMVNLHDFELTGVKEIQIYRGKTGNNLLGNPIGGAINIVTKRPGQDLKQDNGKKKSSSQSIGLGFGSFQNYHLAHQLQKKWQTWAVAHHSMVSGSKGDFHYTNKNQNEKLYRENNDYISFNQQMILDRRGAKIADWDFWLTQRASYKEEGMPGMGTVPLMNTRHKTMHFLVQAQWEKLHWIWQNNKFHGSFFQTLSQDTITDPHFELFLGGKSNETFFYSAGANIGLTHFFADSKLSLYYKSHGHYAKNELGNSDHAIQDRYIRLLQQISGEHHWHLWTTKHWRVSMISTLHWMNHFHKHRDYKTRTDADKNWHNFVNPQISLLINYRNIFAIKGNAQYSFRMPTLWEMYGNQGQIIGNPHLTYETSKGFDAGFIWNKFITIEYAFFYRIVENMISLVQNSQNTSIFTNYQMATIYGHEITARSQWRFLSLSANYTAQFARDKSEIPYYTEKFLPYKPIHNASGHLEIFRHIGQIFHSLYIQYNYQGSNFHDRYNSYANFVKHSQIWDLGGKWIFTYREKKDDHFIAYQYILQIGIKNILDQPRTDVIGYPQPGRQLFLSLNADF